MATVVSRLARAPIDAVQTVAEAQDSELLDSLDSTEFSRHDHDHDEDYSAIGHDHDEDYSAIDHDHAEAYSAIDHDHDEAYSAIGHDHDKDYADIDHNHDEAYSVIGHDHDEDYADISHSHTQDSVSLTEQTASINATNFPNSQTAGCYRVSYTLLCITADAAALTVKASFAWTDGAGATSVDSATLSLATLGRTSGSFVVQVASGAFTYATVVDTIGTAKYAIYVTVEKIL